MSAPAHKSSPEVQVERPIAEELSHFVLSLTHDAIPAAVRERAKHLILDSVGIALASTKYPLRLFRCPRSRSWGPANPLPSASVGVCRCVTRCS